MSEQQEVLTKPVRLIDPVRCQLFDRITRLETSELCSRYVRKCSSFILLQVVDQFSQHLFA